MKSARFYYDDDCPWYDDDDPNCEDGELNDPFSDGELDICVCEDLGY